MLRANKIARIASDFKVDIIKKGTPAPAAIVLNSVLFLYIITV